MIVKLGSVLPTFAYLLSSLDAYYHRFI